MTIGQRSPATHRPVSLVQISEFIDLLTKFISKPDLLARIIEASCPTIISADGKWAVSDTGFLKGRSTVRFGSGHRSLFISPINDRIGTVIPAGGGSPGSVTTEGGVSTSTSS
jgi:hypothetical protein